MKILMFIDSLLSGGKERQLVELIKGLSIYEDIACELVILSINIHYQEIFDQNINIHFIIREKKKDPKIFLKLYNLCKKIKPDIIHSWESMPSIYAFPIAKLLKIKFINGIIRDASLKDFNFRLRFRLTVPFSDVILSNSYAGLKSYKAPIRKSIFIHNGFDFERIKFLQDKNFLINKFELSGFKIVGMVASFSNHKDYKTYIAAAESVIDRKNNVVFLAIGSGKTLEACKKLVRPEYRNRIKFLGKQNDIESIINIFDIGVLATDTRFHAEGISNSIMEYMALAKPVIATKSGGTEELVLDGITGFIVKPFDAKDMYLKICKLLENESNSIEMGEAGKNRIYNFFCLEKMVNSYVKLYKAVLSRSPMDCTFIRACF